MQIESKNLTGHALNWAIGRAQEIPLVWQGSGFTVFQKDPDDEENFDPSRNWTQASKILLPNNVVITKNSDNTLFARVESNEDGLFFGSIGSSPMEAGLRCLVRKVLGATVNVPDAIAMREGVDHAWLARRAEELSVRGSTLATVTGAEPKSSASSSPPPSVANQPPFRPRG